jgi:DNA-binding phage protein
MITALLTGLKTDGLGMAAISQRTGISRPHLYKLIEGEVKNPSFHTVDRLQKLQATLARPKAGEVIKR